MDLPDDIRAAVATAAAAQAVGQAFTAFCDQLAKGDTPIGHGSPAYAAMRQTLDDLDAMDDAACAPFLEVGDAGAYVRGRPVDPAGRRPTLVDRTNEYLQLDSATRSLRKTLDRCRHHHRELYETRGVEL